MEGIDSWSKECFERNEGGKPLAVVRTTEATLMLHVWRALILLATAEGCDTAEIMRRAGVSNP
jgi:hypothetical protein